MSTYTDLHNRVKENITVDYNNRITPQRVRFFNEQNEFWGTLRGHVSAENINIEGGNISGVTIRDAVLTGNIKLPGDYDLGTLGHTVEQISVNLDATKERLYKEEDTRLVEDIKLSIRIDNFKDDVAREFGILSSELTAIDYNISTKIEQELEDEITERKSEDIFLSNNINYLSDEIETTNLNLVCEIKDRVREDEKLLKNINNVNLSSILRDKELSIALSLHNILNIEDFKYARAEMLSTVEHERHYIINKDATTDRYPYIAKDYAVNVYRANIPDARVKFTNDDGITTEIGKIKLDSDTSDKLPLTFTPYANIDDKSIASALIGNKPYSFTETQKLVPTESNGYSIKYKIEDIAGAKLSNAHFELIPSLPEYHKVYLSGTNLMIGKFSDTMPSGACSEISSGQLFIDTNDINLLTFNKFKNIHYDISDDTTLKLETERVTYLGNNEFKLEKNIDTLSYIQLTDISNMSHDEFAKIYDELNGVSGIISDDTGITDLNVTINLPISSIAYLNKNNNFKTVIASTDTIETVVSANIINTSADIDVVYRSDLYKYAFTRTNDVGEITELGIVIPNVRNKILQDMPSYDTVSVDVSQITDIDEFKKVFELHKTVSEEHLWTVEKTSSDEKSVINIKYTEINVLVKITKNIDGKTEITRRKYDVKTDSPVLANPGETYVRYCSGKVDLEQKRTTYEYPTGGTSYAKVDTASSTDDFKQYVLDIDTNNNDVVKIVFPDKSTTDISREFFITIKLDSKVQKSVKAEFIYSDGTPVEIFNNKHKELYIIAGSNPSDWVTYMVNEVRPNKFLITDLNDYEDHLVLEQLRRDLNELSSKHIWLSTALSGDIQKLSSDLSGDIQDLSTALSGDIDKLSNDLSGDIQDLSTSLSNVITEISSDLYVKEDFFGNKGLSGKVDFLLSVDKETMNYKGILPWLSNYTDHSGAIRPYALLSDFIKQSPNILIEDFLKCGDLFKLSATLSCLVDCATASVYLGENDFFVINKDCHISEILTSDLDIFRNSESEVTYLSNWVANNFFNRFTDNELCGNNTFVGNNKFGDVLISALSSTKISADSIITIDETINTLSAQELSAYNVNIYTEWITNSNIDMLDVSSQANISVANIQENNVRDSYLNGYTQISNEVVDKLSVNSLTTLSILDKSVIHDDPSHGPIVTYISTLQDVLDLSVNNLSSQLKDVSSFIYNDHYSKTLSTNISVYYPNDSHISAVVDLLLIKDEITFDLYRLTIRNGALNVNLVEKFEK